MEKTNKTITLASFVYIDKIESFKKYLEKRFGIKNNQVFQYTYSESNKKILTYRVNIIDNYKIDLSTIIPPTVMVHKKGECFYTINALNKLIEELNNLNSGNIIYSDYKINWDEYQNKIIIIKNEELKIIDIVKDFS
jgi:hypothetical protein